jgi:hypothetical protein
LNASSYSIRAAVAATMAKLSIKSKAFQNDDSEEISVILNTVFTILKSSSSATNKEDVG